MNGQFSGHAGQQVMTGTDPAGLDPEALLGALIAPPSPTPPGDERAVAAVIQDALPGLGLPPATVFGRSPERPNLLIRIDGGGSRLMLGGHMDTVAPRNLGSWRTDPYRLEYVDGRLAGLGVADMKSGLVAALLAASPPGRG